MKKKLNQLMAISEVMMVSTRPLTLKQIAVMASRRTGKTMTLAAAERKLREFEKSANFVVIKTTGDNPRSVPRYEAMMGPESIACGLPAGMVSDVPETAPVMKPLNTPQSATPRPINFGRPQPMVVVQPKYEPEPAPTPVAGSRSALAFIETLGGA